MKADRGGPLVVFEVAEDGVAGVLFDLIEGIALGEDRMPQRAAVNPPSGASSTRNTISLIVPPHSF